DTASDQVRWMVQDDQGQTVDRSANLGAENLATEAGDGTAPALVYRDGQPWRLLQRGLTASRANAASGEEEDDRPPRASKSSAKAKKAAEAPTKGKKAQRKNTALVLTTGVSLEPVQATLLQLGWTLGGLSAGVWLLAALLGRWVCRRALLPL